jgi:hypothetical protein
MSPQFGIAAPEIASAPPSWPILMGQKTTYYYKPKEHYYYGEIQFFIITC